jgi:Glycosyltransferase family 87
MPGTTDRKASKPDYDIAELSIALVSGLALAFTMLFLCVVPLSGSIASSRDFVVFWATGQQLVHHASPYDRETMARIEQTAGLNVGNTPLYMRNPPWGLPVAAPLGLVGLRIGALLWSLAMLGCLLASVYMLWQMHGRPSNQLHWLGLSFGPALICVMMGQTSLISLLGYVLFLRLQPTRPFFAGASLWLCTLKPHLFVPFGVVLLVWIAATRSYRLLAGFAAVMAASCALVYGLDPSAWSDYAAMMRSARLDSEYIPCLIVVFRLWLSPHALWLQYVPPALGCAWALAWYWPRRHAWDWTRYGNLLVLVSLIAAPYSWIYDGGLAMPALLQGAYRTRSRVLLVVLAVASLLVEVQLIAGIKVTSPWFLWTAPAWLAWYLFAWAAAGESIVPKPETAV